MAYEVRVTGLHKRFEQLSASTRASKKTFPFTYFRDRTHDLPMVSLEIAFPVYRMANFRTNRQQLQNVRDQELAVDFFSAGQENESAQQEQHEILWKLAQKGQGTSIMPVSKALESDGQTMPLLVTAWGVVVNGNRRLAAMRELSLSDARFYYVDMMVLPEDATEDEIVDIELSLQMAPETKLPYGWTNDALAIESLEARGMKKARIIDKMRISEAEYDERLGSLAQGRLFLSDFVEEPERFELIEDQKQLFLNGYKAVKNKRDDVKAKDLVRAVLYNIADNPTQFGARAYNFITPFERNANKVKDLIRREIEEDLAQYEPPTAEVGADDGLIPEAFGAPVPPDENDKLVAFLLDKNNREIVHFAIKDAVEQFRDPTNKIGDADKERLRKAKKHIANVTLEQVSTESLTQIPVLLTEIRLLLDAINQKLVEVEPMNEAAIAKANAEIIETNAGVDEESSDDATS